MSYPPGFYHIPPEFDNYGPSLVTIRHSHHEIHEGDMYTIGLVQTMTASSTLNCMVTAPDTSVRVHFLMDCTTDGNGVTISIYENPSASGGTPVTPFNRNRNSSNTTTVSFVHTPTITLDGTLLIQYHIGSTKQGGAGQRASDELILKQGTSYLIRVTSDSGTSTVFTGRADWYESEKYQGE